MKIYQTLFFALLLSSAINSFASDEQSTANNFVAHVSYKRPASTWMPSSLDVNPDGSTLRQYVNSSQSFLEAYYTFDIAKDIPDLLNQTLIETQFCDSTEHKIISQTEKEAVYLMHGVNCKIANSAVMDSTLYGKMMLGPDGIYELIYFAIEKIKSPTQIPIKSATVAQIRAGKKAVNESRFR